VSLAGALAAASRHGFTPDGAEVVVRGLCANCRAG
jgi:Fe2+ or Zn2+ uptake regulation protein